ncbi:methyl-accepting chemotaxis protein [Tumebacillus sp. ITR2]|uniref:Methyl-accepting chemotaxis protein n=1 Tax=Tumebacillus amylolyticus TaxID=2801339 RepID=A0ABS1J6L4_9BACL|nr:methyl-accepting chemotaxis protein [Tumebacillus amylolyticus]MBL0385318.1 methyl-accepting chemotaxis protein [Tumebacillus amylolyticus]
MFLRNLKVASKLWVLIGVGVLFLLATGGVSTYYANQIAADSQSMYQDRLLPVQWIGQVRTNNRTVDTDLVEMVLTTDKAEVQRLNQDIENQKLTNAKLIQEYEATNLDPKEVELLEQYKTQLSTYQKMRQNVIDFSLAGKQSQAYGIFDKEVRPVRETLSATLTKLGDYNAEVASNLYVKSDGDVKKASQISLGLLVAALVLMVVIGMLIARTITKPIQRLQALMAQARGGDLTVAGIVKSKDEIGRLTADFNEMILGFNGVVLTLNETAVSLAASAEQLNATTNQTSHATNEITNAIQDMSQGAEVQMRGAEETNSTMRQMSEGLQRVAESANLATESSSVATRESETGASAVHKAVEQMTSIRETVGMSAELVQALGERSREVGQVVELITEVANQVNLLALNAAIEAARAGEHGKGFSVVADEVRQLAEQSRGAATSIHTIIEEMQRNTDQAVLAMQAGTAEVEKGMEAVQQAGESFTRILSMTQDVASQIEDVSASVEEMSAGSEEIASSVDYMADIANQSAQNSQMVVAASQEQLASVEEVANSTAQLSQMAVELQEMIARFKVQA